MSQLMLLNNLTQPQLNSTKVWFDRIILPMFFLQYAHPLLRGPQRDFASLAIPLGTPDAPPGT